MMLEAFADTFNLLEVGAGGVVVKVHVQHSTAFRNFFVPVLGATGYAAMSLACKHLLDVMHADYLTEHGEEYIDVDSNYTVNMYDGDDLIEVHSEGELLDVFLSNLITELKVIEGVDGQVIEH